MKSEFPKWVEMLLSANEMDHKKLSIKSVNVYQEAGGAPIMTLELYLKDVKMPDAIAAFLEEEGLEPEDLSYEEGEAESD